MTEIVIAPADANRIVDAEHALAGGGDGRSCQCQGWTMTNAEWQNTTQAQRAELLHTEMAQTPAPALIAYVDGQAAGWVRVGPRTAQIRLARTIEGYPIDTSAQKKAPNELFRGLLSVFTSAGFEEVARPKADRAIVELTL